jgi:signal transduction histidine kinase
MEPAVEAQLLAAAVERMLVHERLSMRFDEALAEARLEALRELAYGAGHEINNPLANIATRAQALLLEERDAERRRRLATIVDQSFRARDMIGGLMLFARPPKPQPAETDLGGLVASVIDSVQQAAAGRGVRLHYSPSPTPLSAHVDRGQIEEAVRVIAINAIEAVDDGGRVTLSVGMVAGSSAPASGWCEIVVADDGKGMDAASLRRAFDPFYSGREAGRGAGLGLSKAWRFAEASGGRVVVESRPGEGTRVAVVLPTQSLSVAR